MFFYVRCRIQESDLRLSYSFSGSLYHAALKRFLRIQQNGYRPVVAQADQHMGAEAAFGHVHAVAAQEGGYLLIQCFGLFGAGGLGEGGAAAVAGVAVEGELRYQQHFAAI